MISVTLSFLSARFAYYCFFPAFEKAFS